MWAFLLAAAALATTVIGATASDNQVKAQQEANQKNIEATEEANEQSRLWQLEDQAREENLANTAHQREVADLKAAGLNPVLSAGTTGAPVVSTSTATSNPGLVQPVVRDYSWISNSIQSITNLMMMEKLLGGTGYSRAMLGINGAKSFLGFSRRM